MHLNDNLLDQWEHIINTVNKTDVPIECIKKVVVKLAQGRQKTINIHNLIKQGLALEEIENMLTRYFRDNDDIIKDVDFIVDINSVAHIIQPETDKLLNRIK